MGSNGMTKATRKHLDHVITLIPGYDPHAEAGDCTFDYDAAQKAIDFFMHPEDGCLRHVEGEKAGELFILELWQQAIIANLFGWKRPDGTRRYREAFIFVPRKNGKTPMAAAIIAFMLFCDGESGAQIYGAASKYEQATLVFRHVRGMVLQEPWMKDQCQIFNGQSKAITTEDGLSAYRVICAKPEGAHGHNTSCAVVDELHTLPNRDLVDAMETSTANRMQPLLIEITTSDFDRPDSICNEKHDYASKVRDGAVSDPEFLPVIYEASRDDDWTKRETWRKANPNAGVSVSWDYLERACKKARENAAFENTFKRLHLNIRTEQDVRWIQLEDWDKCAGAVNADDLAGQTCCAGLDLASTSDITALVLAFPVEDHVKLLPYFWIPKEARKRDHNIRQLYDQWVKSGHMRETPGNMTDYARVRRDINEIGQTFGIPEIAVDRLFQGAQLAMELGEDGFEVIAHGQGFMSMAAPTLEFETLIKSVRLEHGANPVLRWMAQNVSVELDAAGNMKPSKKASTEKIDGIVAAIMALARLAAAGDFESAYSKQGIMVL